MKNKKLFVGIGSGAVQLGLWAYHAFLSNMDIVLVEVDREKINSIKKNKNSYWINIACFNKINPVKIGPVKIFNPEIPKERKEIVSFISMADEIVTAVPDVSIYETGGIAKLLGQGISKRKKNHPLTVYASENRIKAAYMLEKMVFPGRTPSYIFFSDTVIERMGGLQLNPGLIKKLDLNTITLQSKGALLVEDFDKIIIEKNTLSEKYGFQTGFKKFIHTDKIHIYEEQKLYGHNAVHLLLGVIARLKGYKFMSDYEDDVDFKCIGVDALRLETGGWFKKKYRKSGEQVVTDHGYENWVKQLCQRIINPFLFDSVDRVIRNLDHKLAWDDRIIGTMRNALETGIIPQRYALGAAGALLLSLQKEYDKKDITGKKALSHLTNIWGKGKRIDKKFSEDIIELIGNAFDVVRKWNTRESLYLYAKQTGYFN